MQLIRASNDALGNRVAIRNDDVIASQIQLLDGKRHERQKIFVLLFCKWNFLQKRCLRRPAAENFSMLLRQEINKAENIGVWKLVEHGLEDFLRTGVRNKPFVNKSNAHWSYRPLARVHL
jgi:hypothetical protein